ncbi:uncharacterized protein LOC116251599 [Nymphaea colorata]|nr:uncharacterized protein LOC116251599 [Nymphaea colorata]
MFAVGTISGFPLLSQPYGNDGGGNLVTTTTSGLGSSLFSSHSSCGCMCNLRSSSARKKLASWSMRSVVVSCGGAKAGVVGLEEGIEKESKLLAGSEEGIRKEPKPMADSLRNNKRSADWKAAKAYKDSGVIYEGRIGGFNSGGLLVRFYSLVGFLPYPQLSPSHSCKEPGKAIQEIAKTMVGSIISVKVIHANEEKRKLIFSEKEAMWSNYSNSVKVGDIFEARVGSVEDYGAFVDLRFPDGLYHLTGLLHISEVSWDLVQDVRDVVSEGDEVRVKVIHIDKEKARINLSMKQLEDDPFLVTLDKVIAKEDTSSPETSRSTEEVNAEPFLELKNICQELLQEDGISDVQIGRQGFEKRVVSQDLELWLSNKPASDGQFTLLARAGRQVQEIQLKTSLDLEGIKKAVQRVSGRVQ